MTAGESIFAKTCRHWGARAAAVCLETALALALVLVALPALAQKREGVDVGNNSVFTKLVPAETLEREASAQYQQLQQKAASQNALVPMGNPQVQRLRTIAQRIIPFAMAWNPRAKQWRWEVSLIESPQINAFCMPGGKIAFYTGILKTLQLTDDEVAMVMGHEIAHALREHARERMGKGQATNLGVNVLSQLLGLGQVGQTVTHYGAQLWMLEFSRSDESEADLVGMQLAAQAGFDPHAGISLWKKMGAANKNAPPQWLSTHPSSNTRIADIEANLPKVLPFYREAKASAKKG